MDKERRRAALQQLLVTRLTRSEVLFALSVIGLIAAVGAGVHSLKAQIYLITVFWAALVGVMIPRLIEARRGTPVLEEARQREAIQRIVNHDMASALLSIEGGIQAMFHTLRDSDDEVAESTRSIAHAIETEVRRMRRIAGSTPTRSTRCWVADTLEPLIALHRAGGEAVDVLLACDVKVAMSPDDLVRVLGNILDNCAKYAPRAPVTVSGFLSADQYFLIIRDEGPGIPEGLRDRVCDRGVSSREGGGLGLYSVRSLVEKAGGSVHVKSSHRGTEVQLQFPALAVSLGAPETPATALHWADEAIA